jgi:acetoin utilization deacetylase AcuC-like enzyme
MGTLFTSEACLRHDPRGYPERPARLEAVWEGAEAAGWTRRDVGEGRASVRAIEAVHSAEYVERFARAVERGDGLLDSADNPLTPGTLEAALAAAECAVAAAGWVAEEDHRQAFAAVRPPGHHAERGVAMGFCYFANIALAADELIRVHGLSRVAIFDFDVHHGNGTQHLFEARSDVFFASIHQYPFYPGTGAAGERGRGGGEGATLNGPLPAGTDDAAARAAVEEQILPALRRAAPQVLLVSAGFDGGRRDPIGGWRLDDDTFGWLGEQLGALAVELCAGRVVTFLEGGYSLDGLRLGTEAYLRGIDAACSRPPV